MENSVADDDFINEEIDDRNLTEYELIEIQEEYRRKRLIESLIGPVVSTIFHVVLIILLAVLITDKYKEEAPEIVVQMEQIEEIKIEEPPPIEEPEPVVEPTEDVTNPVLTSVAIENAESEDAALEDTNDDAPSTDDDSTVDAVSDVVVSPSAFASPNVFGGRSAGGRAGSLAKFGGSKVGQSSLLKALWWLAKVQKPDGSWGNSVPEAFTGLALLTFLAHGETPTSKQFGTTVRKGMEWLSNHKARPGQVYGHAIKTYALAEAYAMTGIYSLEDAMNTNIRYVIDGQQEGGSYHYGYNKDQNDKQDLSVAGWNYQALKAAYGAGCEEDGLDAAIYKAVDWLRLRADESENGDGFPYDRAKVEGKSKHTMRAVGVLCLQLFGEGGHKGLKDEIEKISKVDMEKMSWEEPPKESLYGWYYATQAMFQEGGPKWRKWNRKFQKVLTKNQHKEGFWDYPGEYHGNLDELTSRVYATTLSALMLTVYYRYLPSGKGAKGGAEGMVNKKKKPVMEEEGLDLIE